MTWDFSNLGTRLVVAGSEIQSSYFVNGAGGNLQKSIIAGKPPRMRYTVDAALAAGSGVTGITVKAQASDDGVNWYDVDSVSDSGSGSSSVEQSFTVAANTAQVFSILTDGTFANLRLALKATGGAAAAGDSLTVGARMVWR